MATTPRGLRVRQRLAVSARSRPAELPPNLQKYVDTGEALIAEPFRGVTADGNIIPRLFTAHVLLIPGRAASSAPGRAV